MAGELDAAIAAIQLILSEIGDFRSVPEFPPDRPAAYPLLVVWPSSGTWEKEAGAQVRGLHTIRIGAYIPSKDLARDVEKVLPLGEKIKDKLLVDANASWTNTIDNITGQINYTFGPIEYAGQELIGWTIEPEIKIRSAESGGAYVKG